MKDIILKILAIPGVQETILGFIAMAASAVALYLKKALKKHFDLTDADIQEAIDMLEIAKAEGAKLEEKFTHITDITGLTIPEVREVANEVMKEGDTNKKKIWRTIRKLRDIAVKKI